MVIAIKFFDDNFYLNSIYAKIGGISVKELAFLERNFLKMVKYELLIEKETFDDFYKEMVQNYKLLEKPKQLKE
jgi:Cyclin